MTEWTDEDRASWRHACTLESMQGWWAGSDCVVVGGGPSAQEVFRYTLPDLWVIACNRATKWCRPRSPDFAACFEPRKDRDVWDVVLASSATFVLSHIPRDHPRTILSPAKGTIRAWTNAPRYFGQSTFFAIACAIELGFETIGVIGLDLTEDRYPRTRREYAWKESEVAYRGLVTLASKTGQRLINLNPDSNLEAIPTGEWKDVRRK